MIHRFDNLPADLNTRDNIFVLVRAQASRSTAGKVDEVSVPQMKAWVGRLMQVAGRVREAA